MTGNNWKLLEIGGITGMAGIGWNWLEMAGKVWKFLEMAIMAKWAGNGLNGLAWLEWLAITGNGC